MRGQPRSKVIYSMKEGNTGKSFFSLSSTWENKALCFSRQICTELTSFRASHQAWDLWPRPWFSSDSCSCWYREHWQGFLKWRFHVAATGPIHWDNPRFSCDNWTLLDLVSIWPKEIGDSAGPSAAPFTETAQMIGPHQQWDNYLTVVSAVRGPLEHLSRQVGVFSCIGCAIYPPQTLPT